MSLDAFRWACAQEAPSTGAFAVLCALANFTRQGTDVCWPSQKKIATMTRMSRRRVIVHVNALCEAGLVERVINRGRLNYRLRMETVSASALEPELVDEMDDCDETTYPCAVSSHPYAQTAPTCDKTAHPSEPVKEPVNEISKRTDIAIGSLQTRFDEFWELYPKQRRGNKSKALTAYNRALAEKRATEEEIYHGLSAYTQSDEVRRGFAKGAAAWLNDDRWTNDYYRIADQSSSAANQSRESYLDRLSAASRLVREKIYTDDTTY